MKKLKLLVVSALLITLVTGCGMKAEYSINIGKDKDVELEFLVAQDDEMIDSMLNMGSSFGQESSDTKAHTDKERWEYLEGDSEDDFEDFEKTKYDKDGYKGYTYKLSLGNIDKLVAKDDKEVNFNEIGKDAKLFTKKGDVYTLLIKQDDSESQQMEQYSESVKFDVKLKVTLPNKAKSNNATKVDGTTYIWDLTKAKDIKLSFDLNGKSAKDNKIIIIGGACAAAGIVICVVALALSKKKKAA